MSPAVALRPEAWLTGPHSWAGQKTTSERLFFVGWITFPWKITQALLHLLRRLAQGSRGAPLAWCRFFAGGPGSRRPCLQRMELVLRCRSTTRFIAYGHAGREALCARHVRLSKEDTQLTPVLCQAPSRTASYLGRLCDKAGAGSRHCHSAEESLVRDMHNTCDAEKFSMLEPACAAWG